MSSQEEEEIFREVAEQARANGLHTLARERDFHEAISIRVFRIAQQVFYQRGYHIVTGVASEVGEMFERIVRKVLSFLPWLGDL